MIARSLIAAALGLTLAAPVAAQELKRHPLPDSDFPISMAVELPSDADLVYLSGTVPSVTNKEAEQGSREAYGDTETQTVSVLRNIEANLERLDLSMSDVVKMTTFLVAPEEGEAMDFAGFMAGYTQFFGTEAQPNLPVRSVVEVAGLASPAWLVEIEVVAIRP